MTIVGPKQHTDAIDTALTDPVDATGVVGHATFTTHVYVADPLVRVAGVPVLRVTVLTDKSSGKIGRQADNQPK